MTPRLEALTRRCAGGPGALVCGLVAGDPVFAATATHMDTLARHGADMIELVLPFSDAAYHGPVIQRACARALQGGPLRLAKLTDLALRFRERSASCGLLLTSYLNPLLAMDPALACGQLAAAGFDALHVVDLPFESSHWLRQLAQDQGLSLLASVSPTTSAPRRRAIVEGSQSFLIWQADLEEEEDDGTLEALERFCQELLASDRPVLVNLTVGDDQDLARAARCAHGLLVRSSLVWFIEGRGPDLDRRLAELVERLRAALDAR